MLNIKILVCFFMILYAGKKLSLWSLEGKNPGDAGDPIRKKKKP